MTNDQPTQPLTAIDIEDMRDWYNKARDHRVGALLAEVDRLRAILGYVEVPDNQAEEIDIDRLQVMLRTRTEQRDKLESENSALLRKLEDQYRHRAENARLRKQVQDYHESADAHVAKFDRQHERLMEAQGRIDAARAFHQPVTVDWSASPKCKASHGPGWVNWPCPDAFALGMRAKDYNE